MTKKAEKVQEPTAQNTPGTKQNVSSGKSERTNSKWNSEQQGELKVHYSHEYPIAILEDGKDFWPIIGNQKISRTPYKNLEEVEKRIKKTDWEFVGAVVVTLIKNITEQEVINQFRKQDLINLKNK